MDEGRKLWVAQQIKVLLAAGMNPVDVETIMRQVLAMLPTEDVNLMEWVPQQIALEVNPVTIHDARVDWYAKAPAKFKRVLDATIG